MTGSYSTPVGDVVFVVLACVVWFWIPAAAFLAAVAPVITLATSISRKKPYVEELIRVLRWESLAFPLVELVWMERQYLRPRPVLFYFVMCLIGSAAYLGTAVILGNLIKRALEKNPIAQKP